MNLKTYQTAEKWKMISLCADLTNFAIMRAKSNQITFIVTSPQHKCLGEWNSYERAPDSAKKQQQTIYIWTDSAKKTALEHLQLLECIWIQIFLS